MSSSSLLDGTAVANGRPHSFQTATLATTGPALPPGAQAAPCAVKQHELRSGPTSLSRYSLGNPFVHSLLVTLGNHAVHRVRSYNWPCPVGPSGDIGDGRLDISRKQFPGR